MRAPGKDRDVCLGEYAVERRRFVAAYRHWVCCVTAESQISITAIVPTLNEEVNLSTCLGRLDWATRTIVLDSGSTDRTRDIAARFGAEFHHRDFDNHAAQKNWALDNLDIDTDWVLFVDADERVTPSLADEIQHAIADAGSPDALLIPRQNYFMGRKLRHCGMYPDYQLRLFRRGRARYEARTVHEHMLVEGTTGVLQAPFDHRDEKGLERYFDRHNRYSTLEAIEAYRYLHLGEAGNQSPKTMRRRLKQFSYRFLPFRPGFVFLFMYLVKGGVLDGWAGLQYCLLRAHYEHQIDLKIREIYMPSSPMARSYAAHYPDDPPVGQ